MTTAHATHDEPALHMGLPMTNGKLAIWLFLVTEIMFFTGLIGAYIVLRQSAPLVTKESHPAGIFTEEIEHASGSVREAVAKERVRAQLLHSVGPPEVTGAAAAPAAEGEAKGKAAAPAHAETGHLDQRSPAYAPAKELQKRLDGDKDHLPLAPHEVGREVNKLL